MKIIKIEDSNEKSQICEKILRSLPQWFGIESAILDYIRDVEKMETWAAIESETIGFISLNKHNSFTAEIHVMGILKEYHRKNIGTQLIRAAEESLLSQGFKFLTVKTLSEKRPDKNYDKTRNFYLKYGFTAIEEFKTLWGEHNPCLMMIKKLQQHYFAVIFTSKRTSTDHEGYGKMANRMIELSQNQKGFIKAESACNSEGIGITVSYWKSLEDIKNWKTHSEHLLAQELGRSKWYESFTSRVCQVEKEYSFSGGKNDKY